MYVILIDRLYQLCNIFKLKYHEIKKKMKLALRARYKYFYFINKEM